MSMYSNLPPIKPPRSMAWYEKFAREQDDALAEGLRILESLRSVLPQHKRAAIDEAKELLISASELYHEAKHAQDRLLDDPSALAAMLPPEKKRLLCRLCAVLADE
jgi:hypothetical protein